MFRAVSILGAHGSCERYYKPLIAAHPLPGGCWRLWLVIMKWVRGGVAGRSEVGWSVRGRSHRRSRDVRSAFFREDSWECLLYIADFIRHRCAIVSAIRSGAPYHCVNGGRLRFFSPRRRRIVTGPFSLRAFHLYAPTVNLHDAVT